MFRVATYISAKEYFAKKGIIRSHLIDGSKLDAKQVRSVWATQEHVCIKTCITCGS